jgi:hypothetical protein
MGSEPREPVEDRSAGDYQQHFAREAGEETSEVVVRAILSVCDAGLGEIEPLYQTIDLEALDALADCSTDSEPVCVTFEYDQYFVTVYGDERVTIQSAAEGPSVDAGYAQTDPDDGWDPVTD